MKEDSKKILIIPLEKILPNRSQPRIKFSEESILSLADSIKEHGVLQPIIVRTLGDKYEIVAGERRYKATVLSGLKEIPALLFDMNDKESAEIALIENVQRKDLSPIEEALSYKRILDMGYLTQSDLANKIGVSQSAVANKIRLLNLSDDVQEALLDEKISERHARSLLKLEDLEVQVQMLKRVLSKKLTVRALDDEINFYQQNKKFKENNDNVSLNEINKEPVIEIKNSIDKKIEEKNDIEKSIDEPKEESKEKNNDISKIVVDEKKSIFSDISLLTETKNLNSLKGEKDMNNNLQNMNEDINYNTLKNSEGTPGKFFMNIEQDDKPKDNNSMFNFENSNNSSNIFSDLMAPQGSKNLFRPGTTQESVIPVNTDENKQIEPQNDSSTNVSSMFENLMGVSTSNSQEIDKASFDKFMDPSFVDGQVQVEKKNDENINENVFSKFLANSNDEEKSEENSNDLKKDETNNSQQAPTIFSNLFNNKSNDTITSAAEQVDSLSNNMNTNSTPSIFSNINIQPEIKNDNNTEQNEKNIPPVDVASEPKEEIIEQKEESLEPVSTNEEASNLNENDIKNIDIFNGLNDSNKPDLLAPMGTQPLNAESSTEISKVDLNNNETVEENSEEIKNDVEESEEGSSEGNDEKIISFNTTKPIFVTATSDNNETLMPTSPIIDVPEENNNSEENVEVEIPAPAPEVTTLDIDEPDTEVEADINNMIGNQPIIVTDYNKQYDPVIPSAKPQEKIDFKKILNLIRELSETIEKCGYEIDTDEIDLQDKYQVIFNINKE